MLHSPRAIFGGGPSLAPLHQRQARFWQVDAGAVASGRSLVAYCLGRHPAYGPRRDGRRWGARRLERTHGRGSRRGLLLRGRTRLERGGEPRGRAIVSPRLGRAEVAGAPATGADRQRPLPGSQRTRRTAFPEPRERTTGTVPPRVVETSALASHTWWRRSPPSADGEWQLRLERFRTLRSGCAAPKRGHHRGYAPTIDAIVAFARESGVPAETVE
jgi:hypothetical protein